MAFYLRKGFNLGPVRLNVSKGGVGVSGGVTGARLGLSPRGAYVHGGRGGLYYRKYAGSGRRGSAAGTARSPGRHSLQRNSSAAGDSFGEAFTHQRGDKIEVFTDTGVTYPSPVRISEPDSMVIPDLPREQISLYLGFIPGIVLVVLGATGIVGTGFFIAGLVLVITSGGLWSWIDVHNKKARQAAEQWRVQLREALNKQTPSPQSGGQQAPSPQSGGQKNSEPQRHAPLNHKPNAQDYRNTNPDFSAIQASAWQLFDKASGFSGMRRKWIDFQHALHTYEHVADVLHVAQADSAPTGLKQLDEAVHSKLTLTARNIQQIKKAVFQERFRKLTTDYALTKQEEHYLRCLAQQLEFSGSQVREDLDTLDILAEIRDEKGRQPREITVPVRLVRGERAYAVMPGRLLRKKVLQNKTEQGIRYTYTGYETDLEGTVYLTDRRVLVVGEGTRSYRHNKIMDVLLSVEDATVQLVLDGRKSPVILTLERPALFAARLQNVLDEHAEIST